MNERDDGMAMVRWDGTVTCQSSALMIVDIQHDFLDGALAVPGAGEILPTVYSLLDDHQIGWKAVVASQDFHPPNHISFASRHAAPPFTKLLWLPPCHDEIDHPKTIDVWPDHCVQGTKGCLLEPGIESRLKSLLSLGREVKVIQKGTDTEMENYSAFKDDSELDHYLNSLGIRNLFCVGLAGDYCVKATAESALQLGYRVFWVRSGIQSVSGEEGQTAVEESLVNCWPRSFVLVEHVSSVSGLLS